MCCTRTVPLIILLGQVLIYQTQTVTGGTCWSAMIRNGRCTELLMDNSSKEHCCSSYGIATAWSNELLDSGTLFFWRVLGGGVPCSPCKESCTGVQCGQEKTCVIKSGRPKCVCAPKCGNNGEDSNTIGVVKIKRHVCGTDGRSYKNLCRLKKRACRRRNSNLSIAYYGSCQNTCLNIACPSGKHCLLDQNLRPHCVKCTRKCGIHGQPSRRKVCGTDGLTYTSICQLREAACRRGKAIPIAYRGMCKPTASCSTVRCRDRQTCLKEPAVVLNSGNSGRPRCVSCGLRCRSVRPQGGADTICGSNNSTYTSWCHMMQDACARGEVIETSHSGKCTSVTVSQSVLIDHF